MKKLIYIFLIFCNISYSQTQNMAVLPSSMNYGNNNLKTLCIDYIKEIPKIGMHIKNVYIDIIKPVNNGIKK